MTRTLVERVIRRTSTTVPKWLAEVTTTTSRCSFAQSLAIRAKAIFHIYVKTTVVRARAACRHAPKKIYESELPRLLPGDPNGAGKHMKTYQNTLQLPT